MVRINVNVQLGMEKQAIRHVVISTSVFLWTAVRLAQLAKIPTEVLLVLVQRAPLYRLVDKLAIFWMVITPLIFVVSDRY